MSIDLTDPNRVLKIITEGVIGLRVFTPREREAYRDAVIEDWATALKIYRENWPKEGHLDQDESIPPWVDDIDDGRDVWITPWHRQEEEAFLRECVADMDAKKFAMEPHDEDDILVLNTRNVVAFPILESDPFAPQVIRHWANVAEASGQVSPDKIQSARNRARDLEWYQNADCVDIHIPD